MIHVISNKSTFKSGGTNIHTSDYWENGEDLKYMTYNNRHMGIQLDATHDIVGAKMKEVTQMMSALAQNPDSAPRAAEMYEALASNIERAIKKIYGKKIKEGETEESLLKARYTSISKSLVQSLNNSSNKGLAAIIAETFEHGELIPFSNQSFFKEFIKELVVKLNKDFITRYYPGSGTILTPSHNIITIYENENGDKFSQEDVADLAIKWHTSGVSDDRLGKTTEEIIDAYINENFGVREVDTGKIQLLDTVVIDGKLEKLDTIEKYYRFKHKHTSEKV
jgi:hypothetical protein